MAKTILSPELERKYSHALTETLDRIDQLRADLKEETKQRKGEIAQNEKAAFRLRRLLSGKEVEQLEVPGAEIPSIAPRKGITSITLRAGGKEVTATPAQLRAGLAEIDRRKGKIPEPPELKWKPAGSNDVADVPGGCYCLEPSLSPTAPAFTVYWTPTAGKSKRVGVAENVKLARDVASVDWLERAGDRLLKNAGAGELTKADTKGPAVARKKGGRRA